MRNLNKILKFSGNSITNITFIVSFVLFMASFISYLYTVEKSEKELKKVILEISSYISKINFTKQKMDSIYTENKEKLNLKNQIQEMSEKYYTYKTKNSFIEDFSKIIKTNNNLSVARIEYSKSETHNSLQTNLVVIGNYSSIREFIYEIEKTFYFSSITSIGIDKYDTKIKANIEITTYLGDDLIEK